MSHNHFSHRFMLIAACLLLDANLPTYAADPASKDIIKYRQSVMLSLRGHMAAATAIIQGKVDFKDQLAGHVIALETNVKNIPSLFPKNSDIGETKALAAVWNNNDDFLKKAKSAREESAALTKTVVSGDTQNYAQHLKALQDACKACHKDFRKKEEK